MHRKLKLNRLVLIWIMTAVLVLVLGVFVFTNFSRYRQIVAAEAEQSDSSEQSEQSSQSDRTDTEADTQKDANSGAIPEDVRQKLISGDTDGLKIVFMTFDDGPTDQTTTLLDLLDQYDIKGTFFPNRHDEETDGAQFKEIVDRGHTLGNHTVSHNYDLYNNPTSLVAEINQLHDYQTQAIGQEPSRMFRFPGGSLTANQACVDAVTAAGYNYVDWNVSSGDASANGITAEQTAANIIDQVHQHNVSVVLCHAEKKASTMEALPTVFEQLKSEGYTFYKIDDSLQVYPQQI